MTFTLYSILLTAIAYGVGNILLRVFTKDVKGRLDDFVFSAGLGLGILGYSVYIIGSFGFLYTKYIVIVLLIYALISIKPLWRLISGIAWNEIPAKIAELGRFEKFLLAVAIFIPCICLFGVAAPAIGNDALAYHLYHPKIFIQNHRIGYIPFTRESMWPYLTEMLFTLGLLLKNIALAKFFHFLFGLLSILAIFSLVRKFFSKKEALLAASLFCSAPGIFMQSVYAYVDLSLCFYSFIAFYALILWAKNKNTAYLILSGIFTGLAFSVKILGGVTFITLFAIVVYIVARSTLSAAEKEGSGVAKFKPLLIFTFFAFLICCIWYIRSYVVLGNPVYPFLHNIFQSGWETNIGESLGIRRDIIGFLRLPWDIVMHLESFGAEQIGVIFLAFLPVIFFIPFKKDIVKYLCMFLMIYIIIWFWINPRIRFGFVALAVVYVLISVGFYKAIAKYRFLFLKILLCACIVFNVSLCLYYNTDAIKLAFCGINKEEYLFAKERTYPVAEFVNKNLPQKSLLISTAEPRAFYFNRKVLFYDMWKKVSKADISEHIRKLKDNNIPIYVLFTGEVNCKEIELFIIGKRPIYTIAREINEDEVDNYYIFEL